MFQHASSFFLFTVICLVAKALKLQVKHYIRRKQNTLVYTRQLVKQFCSIRQQFDRKSIQQTIAVSYQLHFVIKLMYVATQCGRRQRQRMYRQYLRHAKCSGTQKHVLRHTKKSVSKLILEDLTRAQLKTNMLEILQ